MGLFNILHININKLPVSPEEMKLLERVQFHTKFHSMLYTDMYITDKGHFEFDFKYSGLSERLRLKKFTAIIEFHTATPVIGEFWEFVARFKNGNLVKLKRVSRSRD